MTFRFSHILLFFVIFASMWVHGGNVHVQQMDGMDMDDMGSSCLEHCLRAVQAEEAGGGLVPMVPAMTLSASVERVVPRSRSWTNVHVDSHHDPGRILTTIKRE